MAEEILGGWTVARFWDGVQNKHQKELEAVCDQYLPLVFEDYVIVRHAPCCGIVFQSLCRSA